MSASVLFCVPGLMTTWAQRVDLTDPLMAIFFMTGVGAWIGLVVSGLWFVLAGPVFMLKTYFESRRTVRLLFGEEETIPSTPFGYHTILDVNGGAALQLPVYDRDGELI